MDRLKTSRILKDIYRRLFARYGPQHWWPAETPFEVIVGAILTQSAAWTNVEKAIQNLKQADALKPDALRNIPRDKLANLIHACGYFNAKARKLKAFVEWFGEGYNDNLKRLFAIEINPLREKLLGVHGIGEETADSILLYAGNKPIFVIDAYTRRIMGRVGLKPTKDNYAGWQRLFMDNLDADVKLFNEYHALLVTLGKNICKTHPQCGQCPLNIDICRHLHV
jgi:endonuclease-3 related protein